MNERLKELAEQLGYNVNFKPSTDEVDRSYQVVSNDFAEKFAELIVKDCYVALFPALRDMISRGQAYEMIKQHFGVEEHKGWVCPKCGVDRTKDVCPKGDSAALTGDCPMIATAQTGVK